MTPPEGHTKWSWRVKRFHDFYKISTLIYCAVLVIAGAVNLVVFFNYRYDEKVSKFFMNSASLLIYASVSTQLLTANVIFRRCPLTLLEYQLCGNMKEYVKRYWVCRLPHRWAVTLLVGITATTFLVAVTLIANFMRFFNESINGQVP